MRRVITCAGWTCGLKSWSRRSHRWRTRLQSIAGQSQLTKRQASCAQWTGGSGLGDTAQEARPHLTDAVGAVNLQARRRRTRLRGALGTQLAPWRPEGRSFRSVRSDRLKPLKGLTGRPKAEPDRSTSSDTRYIVLFYIASRPRGNGLWHRDDPSRDKFEVMPTEPEDGDGTSVTAVADLV